MYMLTKGLLIVDSNLHAFPSLNEEGTPSHQHYHKDLGKRTLMQPYSA